MLNKFRKVWLSFRPLPKLHSPTGLRKGVDPECQFLRELLVSIGSWPQEDLMEFLSEMGIPAPKKKAGPNGPYWAVRKVIYDVFNVWDDGMGQYCDINLIEEVLNMARVAKKAPVPEVDEDEDDIVAEPTPKARRGRKAAAPAPEPEPAPKPARGRKAAKPAMDEDEDEDEKPAKKAAASAGRTPVDTVYVAKNTPVWDALEDGRNSTVVVAEDASFVGANQKLVGEFMKSRGRKKTTAQMAIDHLVSEGVAQGYADYTVGNMINLGRLEVV